MKLMNKLWAACIVAGCLLITGSLAMVIWRQYSVSIAQTSNEDAVEIITQLIPQPENAVIENRSDNTMPSLSVDGIDYIGLLEIPVFSRVLPVRAWYGSGSPYRYSGSAYDGSLVVWATTQKGQFDFYRDMCVNDLLYFTDMTGDRFSYQVQDIVYTADFDNMESSGLMLVIKNDYSFEYIVVLCSPVG